LLSHQILVGVVAQQDPVSSRNACANSIRPPAHVNLVTSEVLLQEDDDLFEYDDYLLRKSIVGSPAPIATPASTPTRTSLIQCISAITLMIEPTCPPPTTTTHISRRPP
jgi:hypothetical protein